MTNRLKPTLSTLHLWGIAVALVIRGVLWLELWRGRSGHAGFLVSPLMAGG